MNYARNFYNDEIIPQPDMKYCKYDKRMYHQIDGAWEAIEEVKVTIEEDDATATTED